MGSLTDGSVEEGKDGQSVRVESESHDRAFANRSEQGDVAELFAGEDAGDVDLDDRHTDGFYGIGDRYRSVGVSSGIEGDPVVCPVGSVQGIDDFALHVRLEIGDLDLRKTGTEFAEVGVEIAVAVNGRFALAQKVEVGTVDNQYFHGRIIVLSRGYPEADFGDKDTQIERSLQGDCPRYLWFLPPLLIPFLFLGSAGEKNGRAICRSLQLHYFYGKFEKETMERRGEFALITRIRECFETIGERDIEGIGDDCAVIPMAGEDRMVLTTDLLTEGIHFLLDATSPEELGRKSLAVNLSDVAAMGATPFASLLSVALPERLRGEWIDRFMEGYRELSARYGVALVGGDTTSSHSGLTVNVVALGRIRKDRIKRRSAASAGDLIVTTGVLGASAAGLRDILAGAFDTPLASVHRNPEPQIEEGAWLGERCEVHAMMDLSDGLASDLLHILRASGVAARVDSERIPVASGATLQDAVAGGEDYKLLFTVDPTAFDRLAIDFERRFGTSLCSFGTIEKGEPRIEWFGARAAICAASRGYTHF